MARVFLIRHGRPTSVWGGEDGDPGLDPEGRRQALAAADTLSRLPAAERPTKVASSPLKRCLETARPLAAALGVQVEIVPEVGEIPTPGGMGANRGTWLREALAGRWSDIRGDLDYDGWRHGVWQAVRERPGTAIFTHFVAINAVLSVIDGAHQVITSRPDHTSITTLEVIGARLSLVEAGREASTGVL